MCRMVLCLAAMCWASTAVAQTQYFETPTKQQINDNLQRWAEQRPDLLRLETIGESAAGFPILLCHFTDQREPAEHKQHVLLTASHTRELAMPSYLLFLGKWLLSDDPQAAEILKRQNVMIIPLSSPDEYPGPKRDVYGVWSFEGTTAPDQPEAVAFQSVIDTYLPEVHIDAHGTSNALGSMLSSSVNFRGAAGGWGRMFLSAFPTLMDRAGEELGMIMPYGDEGDGAITVTAPVSGANEHFYSRVGRIVSYVYTYHKSHALATAYEVGFVERYLASMKALLAEGNKVGRWERYPGYPVNQIANELSVAVSAWGDTADRRRASRVELWAKKANVNPGLFHPETRGYVNAIVITDPDLRQRLMANEEGKVEGYPLAAQFLANLRQEPIASDYNLHAIEQSTEAIRQFRDPQGLRVFFNHFYTVNQPTDDPIIHQGMNIRVFIPYKDPDIQEILLDGHPVSSSDTDGVAVYYKPGTVVEVSIPPGKVKPLHMVTVTYEPDEERRYGFTKEDWKLDP